jgi:endoglucanase
MPGADKWPEPTWPLVDDKGQRWDRARLRRERIVPWQALAEKGVGVHVGEWGAHHFTPHAVVLAWMRDWLAVWKEAGWGWALWNLRGSFGVLDSGRRDVTYDDFHGHRLDRPMLDVLRSS